jgi:enoyl-CoA hydratase/carnithine racemase
MTVPLGATLARDGLVQAWVEEGMAVIRLNRPGKRNALNDALITDLEETLRWALAEDSARVLVLTGSEQAFCAGGDISMFTELNAERGYDFTRRGYDLLRPLETGEKPVIAAVEGYCIAGGLELALACDFIIAGAGARFGFGEIDLGLIPGWGGTVRVARAISPRRARQMVMTCERIKAPEALRLGLANEVVPAGSALQRACELAIQIASKPALAVRAAKMTMTQAADAASTDAALAVERSACAALFGTAAVSALAQAWIDKASAVA